MMKKKVLVIGSTGTIGSAVVSELEHDCDVIKVGGSSGDYTVDIAYVYHYWTEGQYHEKGRLFPYLLYIYLILLVFVLIIKNYPGFLPS